MSNISSKPARLGYGYINVLLRGAVKINMYPIVKGKVAESEKLRTFHIPMSLRIQIITKLHICSEYTRQFPDNETENNKLLLWCVKDILPVPLSKILLCNIY